MKRRKNRKQQKSDSRSVIAPETPRAEPSAEQVAGDETKGFTQEPQPRENFLSSPLAQRILMAIRNNREGLNDLQLDYIFGRRKLAPQREQILRQLQGLDLIRLVPTGRGGRLWQANYERRIPTKTTPNT